MKQKLLILFLIISMIFTLSACKEEPVEETVGPSIISHDFAAAFAKIPSDAVMLTVNGDNVLWEELSYWIYYFTSSLGNYGLQITDWNAQYDEDITYGEFVLNNAVGYCKIYRALDALANEYNIVFDENDEAQLQARWDAEVAKYANEDELVSVLAQNFCTPEMYRYLLHHEILYSKCATAVFGEKYSNLPEEEILAAVADDGYLMAKHILIRTQDQSGYPLPEDEIAAAREKAENILADLRSYEGDDPEAYFDELMAANTQDNGYAIAKDGYLFQVGDMVEVFTEGTQALAEYEISDIVESNYGYHIIMRLPINVDATPQAYRAYAAVGYDYSLRSIVGEEKFQDVLSRYEANLTVVTHDAFDTLILAELFPASE